LPVGPPGYVWVPVPVAGPRLFDEEDSSPLFFLISFLPPTPTVSGRPYGQFASGG
jgi:hypothetical protein